MPSFASAGYQARRGRGRGPRSPVVKEKVGSDFDFTAAQFDKKSIEEEFKEKKICAEAGAEAGEWFRLQPGKDKCRDVVSCTASVRYFTSFLLYKFRT